MPKPEKWLISRRTFLLSTVLTTGALLFSRPGAAAASDRPSCARQEPQDGTACATPSIPTMASPSCTVPPFKKVEELLEQFHFAECPAKAEGNCLKVYSRGSGPAVVVLHELPGLTKEDLELGYRLSKEGFTVYMPLLFGEPGQSKLIGPMAHVLFGSPLPLLSGGSNIETVQWLSPLCETAHKDCGGRGVGVIGMCLTGHLPLTLLTQPSVVAPVLCQPTVPYPSSFLPWRRPALGISEDELSAARAALHERNLKILALRFTGDAKCPGERFARLCTEFGREHVEAIEIESPCPRYDIGSCAHSVLAEEYRCPPEDHPTHQAYLRVVQFLRERLTG